MGKISNGMDEQEKDFELSQDDVDDSVVEEEHMSEKVKNLKEKLKEAEGKAKEYLDGWQRAQADFVNVRKRDDEAKNEFLKFANSDLIYQLMPVLDSLELSLPHPSTSSGQVVNGLEAIYKQIL